MHEEKLLPSARADSLSLAKQPRQLVGNRRDGSARQTSLKGLV